MSLLARITTVTADYAHLHEVQRTPNLNGLVAGEALLAGAPCHIEGDGMVYMSNGTAANADAVVVGWTIKPYVVGEPVTLFGDGTVMEYGSGLTPGARYFLATTDGRLDTAATTGGTTAIAVALDAKRIMTKTF